MYIKENIKSDHYVFDDQIPSSEYPKRIRQTKKVWIDQNFGEGNEKHFYNYMINFWLAVSFIICFQCSFKGAYYSDDQNSVNDRLLLYK